MNTAGQAKSQDGDGCGCGAEKQTASPPAASSEASCCGGEAATAHAHDAQKKRVPGYPQDMMMIMDKEVAKPETYGLPPGWTASMMGMMTLVRVLPPQEYDEIQRRIREGIVEAPQAPQTLPGHKHD